MRYIICGVFRTWQVCRNEGRMNEKARRLAARTLLVAATFAAVMGFNFTGNPVFVALPFAAGVALVLVVRMRPKEIREQDELSIRKKRKQGMAQVAISCLMISGFIVYRCIVEDWGEVVGFSIMLIALLTLAVLAYLFYTRAPIERPGAAGAKGAATGCDEPGQADRLHAEEELEVRLATGHKAARSKAGPLDQ